MSVANIFFKVFSAKICSSFYIPLCSSGTHWGFLPPPPSIHLPPALTPVPRFFLPSQVSHVAAARGRKSQHPCLVFEALVFVWHFSKRHPHPSQSYSSYWKTLSIFALGGLCKESPFTLHAP